MIGSSLMPGPLMPGPLLPAPLSADGSARRIAVVARKVAGNADRLRRLFLWASAGKKWAWNQRLTFSGAYAALRKKYAADTGKSPGPWPVPSGPKKAPQRSEFGL